MKNLTTLTYQPRFLIVSDSIFKLPDKEKHEILEMIALNSGYKVKELMSESEYRSHQEFTVPNIVMQEALELMLDKEIDEKYRLEIRSKLLSWFMHEKMGEKAGIGLRVGTRVPG